MVAALVTVYYASESQKFAQGSQRYAEQTLNLTENITKINENISELNQEMIDWYKNPEPLLVNITNLNNNTAFVKRFYGLQSLSETMEDSSEIKVKLRNVGRNAARDLTVELEFQIYSYGHRVGIENPEPEHPHPVKIYSVSTSPSSNNIEYNETCKCTVLNDIVYICADEQGFIPTEDCQKITMYIGHIEQEQEKTINIKLFSINFVTADMILLIKDSNENELQKLNIALVVM